MTISALKTLIKEANPTTAMKKSKNNSENVETPKEGIHSIAPRDQPSPSNQNSTIDRCVGKCAGRTDLNTF